MSKRSPQSEDPALLLREFQKLIENFSLFIREESDVRMRVQRFIPLSDHFRHIGLSLLPCDDRAARDRILSYLRRYPKQVLEGDELAVVGGISEWARRLRELRVQFGWEIASGVTIRQIAESEPEALPDLNRTLRQDPLKLKPTQYVLLSTTQDRDAAHRWNLLNSIRKENLSVKDKLLKFFRSNIGKQVTGEELRYLAKDATEWARRTRELRTEDGWAVVTRNTGRPELNVGVYMLEHDRQAEPHDRKIPDDVRVSVLVRDNFSCVNCGWKKEQRRSDDPRNFLELHHKLHHAKGGKNTADNLVTLCNVCHDKVHREDKT